MAINTAAFSPKEWTVSVAAETTVGTSIAANFKAMEVESFSFPTINDAVREVAPRTGTTSRIVNSGDLVYIEAGGVHEVSISGFLNKTIFPILADNACGEAKSSHIITIDYDHQPVHFLAGASGSGGHNTLSFCFEAPAGAGNDTYVLTGCMITSFTISADSSEDGRFKFDLTAQTRYPFTTTAVAQSVNTVAAFVETYLYLGDFSIKRVFNAEIILDSFGLTIENPVAFLGNSTNTGIPNAFQRSIPEFKATANCVVKYDAATDGDEYFDGLADEAHPARRYASYAPVTNSLIDVSDLHPGCNHVVSFDYHVTEEDGNAANWVHIANHIGCKVGGITNTEATQNNLFVYHYYRDFEFLYTRS